MYTFNSHPPYMEGRRDEKGMALEEEEEEETDEDEDGEDDDDEGEVGLEEEGW